MTTKLKLYTSPSAFPNPQRLRLFMHEKGIIQQVEEVIYDMAPGGQQRKWPHLKMNPWGETPTLDLGNGHFLSESTGIARYMDQQFSGRKIMGETALEQGQDTMWDSRIFTHVLYRIVTMFNPLILVDGIETSEDPILLARPAAYAVSYGRRLGH